MKKFSVVLAVVVLLGFLLAWNPGFSEAAVRVKSGAQDPAQLATASILPVKVSSKTDTIVILYRDSSDTATATGTAGDIKLTFYTTSCAKGNDVMTNLTRGEVQFGDDAGRFAVGKSWFGSAASLFQADGPGVILGAPLYPTGTTPDTSGLRWGMSGLVVDNDILALYERQGYPAVVKQATATDMDPPGATNSVWAGFSNANFEDFYLYGSGFKTYIQLVCPDSTLMADMNAIATMTTTSPTYEIPVINVYKDDETLINSLHDKTCNCFQEDPGSISTIMALNANVLGLFHMEVYSTQYAAGSRVIAVTGTGGTFTGLYVDGRIRRGTSATPATP